MRVGIIFGAFDFLHAGHVHILRQCKKYCEYLVVGLHIDPSIQRKEKNKPIETLVERQIKLKGCRYVDEIIVYRNEVDLVNVLLYYKPDIRFLGSDYKNNNKHISFKDNFPIKYLDSISPTSTELRERIKK